ncbi:MAG: YdeI/OmpD-associated family protein [Pirellula sp.]|jgi:uncharacterized protein YdeI (YjbR/CyaY-like superfamily)
MNRATKDASLYFAEGCGRCPLKATPQCKVHAWASELKYLRGILSKTELVEELKWGVPCYTYNGKNVAIIAAFKEYCSISFFKGVLLPDPDRILVKPGENTQASRLVRFTSFDQIVDLEPSIHKLIGHAIDVERKGLQVARDAKQELVYPEELVTAFQSVKGLRNAFEKLTPGRQRAYVLFFTAPKQSKTRASRIEKCVAQILEGKALHD